MTSETRQRLVDWATTYNNREFFEEDPVVFPRRFADNGSRLQDIEVAAVFAAHFAWGRRAMIVRDTTRLLDEMGWRPFDYVMNGDYRDDDSSIHRTIKWSEVAAICGRLRDYYLSDVADAVSEGRAVHGTEVGGPSKTVKSAKPTVSDAAPLKSLEYLTQEQMRVMIYGQKVDPRAANKKINMLRRWMVRDDGKVDLGVWRHTDKRDLIIPLDVHVYRQAFELGLTKRKPKDIVTAREITDTFKDIFPDDPCLGDFSLFGYGVNNQ